MISCPCNVHDYRLLVPKNAHIILIHISHYLYYYGTLCICKILCCAVHMNSIVRTNLLLSFKLCGSDLPENGDRPKHVAAR